MCFDHDSHPPIPPIAGAAVDGHLIELVSEDGTPFMAYEARATAPTGAGMVILPDVRGLHHYYEELALRFAEAGIDAVAIDYFGRTAPGQDRGENFDYQPHVAQLRYDNVVEDVSAAPHRLRELAKPRALFSVGFCMGGRYSFLMATRADLRMAGVIGFYGWPTGAHRSGSPAPADLASETHAPVLGLFGGADQGITPDLVETYDKALADAGVDHEIVTYPNAPHSFFDRKFAEFATESADAWQRVLDFVKRHTPAVTG